MKLINDMSSADYLRFDVQSTLFVNSSKNVQKPRREEYASLLDQATSHSGVREQMRTFENWWELEKELIVYRVVSTERGRVMDTNKTNFDPTF